MRRTLAVLAGLLVLVLLGVLLLLAWLATSVRPFPQQLQELVLPAPAPLPPPPVLVRAPPPPQEPPAPRADDIAAAHAAIAERLGYTAIRCYVGREYDGQHFTDFPYRPSVENGWFTALVTETEGEAIVTVRVGGGPLETIAQMLAMELEPVFEVSWAAAEGEVETDCLVHPLRRATLVVRVDDPDTDEDDPLLESMPDLALPNVTGCGLYQRAENGVAQGEVLVVRTAPRCTVEAEVFNRRSGSIEIEALQPGETREVQIVLDQPPRDSSREMVERLFDLPEIEAEIEELTALVATFPAGSSAHEKTAAMLAHRQGMRKSALEMQEMLALDQDEEDGLITPVERLELTPEGTREQLEELGVDLDEVIDLMEQAEELEQAASGEPAAPTP